MSAVSSAVAWKDRAVLDISLADDQRPAFVLSVKQVADGGFNEGPFVLHHDDLLQA